MQITTVQWNIGGGIIRGSDSDATLTQSYDIESVEYVTETLAKLNPDIITLQETHLGQAEQIAQALKLPHFVNHDYDHSHLKDGERLGQAVISRFPILKSTFELFYNPHYKIINEDGKEWTSHDKGMTSCTLQLPDSIDLFVQTLHLIPFRKFNIDLNDPDYLMVVEDITNKVDSKNLPFLLQGDFNHNDETLKSFIPKVFTDDLQEVLIARPTTPKGNKYDHILFRGLKLSSFRIFDQVLTDHYPLISVFNNE